VTERRWLAALLVVLLLAGACTRDEDEAAETGDTDTTVEQADDGDDGNDDGDGDGDGTNLDQGGFGDLDAVCSEGDGDAELDASDEGVTADSIRIGVFSDKGNTVASGLNREMYDVAEAFADWCNEHGGILGRQIEVDDLDAKLFEFEARINEACGTEFALVGGGAVFDDDPNDIRVGCDLPNIAGYVVTPRARTAELQVQPVPNPLHSMPMGHYQQAGEMFPEGTTQYGIMTGDLPATQLVRDQTVDALEIMGWEVVYDREYTSLGETGWRNFVQQMRDADVRILEFVGQPANLVQLVRAMDTEGWYPDLIVQQANFYDETFAEEGGAVAGNTLIRSVFHPFEAADENKATQDYLDLMEEYNPRGKVALLGAQGLSAWLLFARAATECGADLTRECLLEEAGSISDWTGGGLHAQQQPGNTEHSPCFLLLSVDGDGFAYDEEATAPNDGLYNCEEDNIVELEDDYGVPRPGE
jgi:ABC-type branched-subunit amino acid transport system substrate-binding protein